MLGRGGGELAEPRGEIAIDHGAPPQLWLCLRDQYYAYAVWLDSGKREFYDLEKDSIERTNLVDVERELAAQEEIWRRL